MIEDHMIPDLLGFLDEIDGMDLTAAERTLRLCTINEGGIWVEPAPENAHCSPEILFHGVSANGESMTDCVSNWLSAARNIRKGVIADALPDSVG